MEVFEIDYLVIGGGVSGVSIAHRLSLEGQKSILVERNNQLAQEVSSRNSEVIHAGLYYQKESLKSELCIRGKNLLYEYLSKNNIEHQRCGKFILAADSLEEEKLLKIKENANSCGVTDLIFDQKQIQQYNFLKFESSLFSPSSGIFDSYGFITSLSNEYTENVGLLLLGNELQKLDIVKNQFEALIVDLNNSEEFILKTNNLINCAGLEAYNLLNKFLSIDKHKPLYQKGEYYSYIGKEKLNHLIYPLPGEISLGIHATIDLGSGIRFGPSSYPVSELDYEISLSQRDNFFNSIQKYWPNIKKEELVPSYSGIRPLIQGLDDFCIDIEKLDENVLVSILGYASPGLTSSLALAEQVTAQVFKL